MCTKSFFAFAQRKLGLYVSHKNEDFPKQRNLIFLAEGFVCLFVMFYPSKMSAGDVKQNVDKTAKRSHLSCNKA